MFPVHTTRLPAALGLALLVVAGTPARADQATFEAQCAACHSIGGGRRVGPDLLGVTGRRGADWLVQAIQSFQGLADSGDADAQAMLAEYGMAMPPFSLSDDQVRSVLAFIDSQGAAGPQTAGSPAQAEAPVDEATADPAAVAKGRDLFSGVSRLSAGGPPCSGCHHVAGSDAPGGGTLARDLSDAGTRLGTATLQGIVQGAPFPAMAASYGDHPVTADEAGALAAYLVDAAQGEAPASSPTTGALAAGGLAGTGALIGLCSLMWSGRRKRSVYQDIYDRQTR